MLEVKIEGIYESDIGSGQKKFRPFEYTYKTARINQKGLFTHALRRHAPYLIQKDKKNANTLYSRIKFLNISDIKTLDEKCYLEGKNVAELNDWEIQDLACLYDLYEIPLHGICSLTELREKAMLAYLEYVLKVPMKTPEEKDALDFFEKEENGTYKFKPEGLNLPIEIYDSLIEKKQGTPKKKDINYFIKRAGLNVANGILNITGNQTVEIANEESSDESESKNEFPSSNDLLVSMNNQFGSENHTF